MNWRGCEEFLPKGKLYVANVTTDDSILTPEEGTELVTDKIALAAHKAWVGRKKAYYTNEFGRAAVGMCRRVCYDDGSAQMWGDTNTANFVSLEGGNDSGIELRDAVVGIYGDKALKLATTAPPVDGKANAALKKLLSKWLGVPQAQIELKSGLTGRDKQFVISGIPLTETVNKLVENSK